MMGDILRSYKELIEKLKLEKIDDMKCLPCEIKIDDFDDTVIDDKHLPYDVMNIVEEYDDRTYLMLTKNTDGDWTKNTRVNGFCELIGENNLVHYSCGRGDKFIYKGYYRNHNNVRSVIKDDNCYKNIRLIYNDGG